jgi:ubiquinone/menaquinone biosynthesis C-methylase UbiE
MRRPDFIARQARQPSGALGWLIGNIMSIETRSLNEAALAALEIQPTDQVLEIGFGHGRTLKKATELASAGVVHGVDFSATMLGMAERSCRTLVDAGRLRLALADSAVLPYAEEAFDKIYSVHTLYFWPRPEVQLREIRRVLRRAGRFVLGLRTKDSRGAEDFADTIYSFHRADDVCAMFERAGFGEVTVVAPAVQTPGLVLVTGRSLFRR